MPIEDFHQQGRLPPPGTDPLELASAVYMQSQQPPSSHATDVTVNTGLTPSQITSTFDLVSSSTYTEVGSMTVGAGMLASTGTVLVWAGGDYLNNTGSNKTLSFSLTLGASTLWDSGVSDNIGAGATRRAWSFWAVIQAMNSTSSQSAFGQFSMGDNNAPTTGTGVIHYGDVKFLGPFMGATTSEDMTAAQAVGLWAKHSANSGSLSFTLQAAKILVIP